MGSRGTIESIPVGLVKFLEQEWVECNARKSS